ncbi:hypothetical protein M409DRAFT_53130 [Zasmidium cellare ATCC 36951]|uniref:malate dehydrogenase n=1 Tax=Zasmidium cellare ATCC 36951 TaxID=1080233 RepID=A0A6A6CMT5_ZASCE|nr:uncharacterized protein M409DRAFT_53130 [Zasmidium cellare ATCC 36951]KAF2168454.1 hypothetical protein M409DRAFT_53130 [Zasmidium cellare ATCC 36951]
MDLPVAFETGSHGDKALGPSSSVTASPSGSASSLLFEPLNTIITIHNATLLMACPSMAAFAIKRLCGYPQSRVVASRRRLGESRVLPAAPAQTESLTLRAVPRPLGDLFIPGGHYEPRNAVFSGLGQQAPPDARAYRRPAKIKTIQTPKCGVCHTRGLDVPDPPQAAPDHTSAIDVDQHPIRSWHRDACLLGEEKQNTIAGLNRLFKINAAIVQGLIEDNADNARDALILVISNPVNSTVPVATEVFGEEVQVDSNRHHVQLLPWLAQPLGLCLWGWNWTWSLCPGLRILLAVRDGRFGDHNRLTTRWSLGEALMRKDAMGRLALRVATLGDHNRSALAAGSQHDNAALGISKGDEVVVRLFSWRSYERLRTASDRFDTPATRERASEPTHITHIARATTMSCFTSQPSNTSSTHIRPNGCHLLRHRYDASDLASLVTSQLIDADMHEQVQRSKLVEWREVTSRLKAHLKETGEVPRKGEMEHLIDLIAAIFLSYGLKHVKFCWKRSKNAFGVTISGRQPGELDDWVEVQIDPDDWHVKAGTPDHFTSIISTLLHECVHAFLDSYTCDGECQNST